MSSLLFSVLLRFIISFCILIGLAMALLILFRIKNRRKEKYFKAKENHWHSHILNHLILSDEELANHRPIAITRYERLAFVEFLLRYALRLAGKERQAMRLIARPYLPYIVQLLQQGNPAQRSQSVYLLSMLGEAPHFKDIVEATADPDLQVALSAFRGLMQQKETHRLPYDLSIVLSRFKHLNPNFMAKIIAEAGGTIALSLNSILSDRSLEPEIRVFAGKSLRLLKSLGSVDIALKLANDAEENPFVLAQALKILGQFGQAIHLPVVRPLIHTDDTVVAIGAISVLASIGEKSDIQQLSMLLTHNSPWISLKAAEAIVKLGGENELKALIFDPRFKSCETLIKEVLQEMPVGPV